VINAQIILQDQSLCWSLYIHSSVVLTVLKIVGMCVAGGVQYFQSAACKKLHIHEACTI